MPCDVTSMAYAYYSKRNFSRKKQANERLWKKLPTIFRYFYTEAIKRRGEISLHKHFNFYYITTIFGLVLCIIWMVNSNLER